MVYVPPHFNWDLPINPPEYDGPEPEPDPETVPPTEFAKVDFHWLVSTKDRTKCLAYWSAYLPEEHAEHGAGMWYVQDVDNVHKFTARDMAAHWFVYHSPVHEPQDDRS